MKLIFGCDNHANAFSKKEQTYTLEELGLTKEEWNSMTEEEKYKIAMDSFEVEYWIKEIEDQSRQSNGRDKTLKMSKVRVRISPWTPKKENYYANYSEDGK